MPRTEDHPYTLRVDRPEGGSLDAPVDDFAGAVRAAERLAPIVPHDATWRVLPTGGTP